MKRTFWLILTITAAVFFAACSGAPADNKPANNSNTNANAAKPTAAAPTKEALMAIDTKAMDAWKNHDTKFWDGFLADNFVGYMDGKRTTKADIVKYMTDVKCDVKSFSMSDEQMVPAGADAAILTYKTTQDAKCNDKPEPANTWAASVFVRSGDTWKGAYHNEMPIMDANAKPEAPKPAEDKKAPEGDKKAAADEKKPDTAANSAKPAETADDALVAAVKKGWDAWKNRDAKGLGDVITKDFVLIDPMGKRYDNAGALKAWTEEKCEIKSVSFEDAMGTMMTKDMGIVTLKGIADGTCDGHPAGSLFGSYIMVKDGDAWKAAMIFETLAK